MRKLSRWTLCVFSLIIMPFISATANADKYQRTITFKNDFPFVVYPVIQVSASTCEPGNNGVKRILVNSEVAGGGVGTGQQVKVNIPGTMTDKPVVDPATGKKAKKGCWYDAGRVYIFAVNVLQFEDLMKKLDVNNKDMTTTLYSTQPVGLCNGVCQMGSAKASYAADAPAQLAEYTFDSDNGTEDGGPNSGTPMADIDISYVDDVYLPLAASVDNNGATGYMGAVINLDTFISRMKSFVFGQQAGVNKWPFYAAYDVAHWSDDPKVNSFTSLLPPGLGKAKTNILPHFPAGYNIINNTLGRPSSALYRVNGSPDFLISNVSYKDGIPSNPVTQKYIDRWMFWVTGNPCSNLDGLKWPDNVSDKFNKANFCAKFKENISYIWNHFTNDPVDGFNGNAGVYEGGKSVLNGKNSLAFYADCGLFDFSSYNPNPGAGKLPVAPLITSDPNVKNACIIQHIVGYNSKILGGELPGRVQAALRGVAYDPEDGGQQYQFDPFLLFAMPYDSKFNLDPFTRFIHNEKDGMGAVAYSFSIDDKYGNYRDAASGFTVDAGGVSALINKTPYDPYQQYRVSWGFNPGGNNWESASICGNKIDIKSPGNHSLTITKDSPCEIVFTDSKKRNLSFKMGLVSFPVIDQYTGASVNVLGFGVGALPPPPPTNPPPAITSYLSANDVAYCLAHSSPEFATVCKLQANVSATWAVDRFARDVVYMGLKFEDMPRVNLNLPPAPAN